jgi:predicted RNA binding protein YcfA (HicA-like mRNA interferase family)
MCKKLCIFYLNKGRNKMTALEVIKRLQAAGWKIVHGRKHDKAYSPDGSIMEPIPRHSGKDIAVGTLARIASRTGVPMK